MNHQERSFGVLFRMLNEGFIRRFNRSIQELDLTIQQSHMLKVLSMREEHSCSLKEMERIFGMAQSTIAGMAARLEKKGLIESFVDPDDRRKKLIRLTEAGADAVASVHGSIAAAEKEALSVLSQEEQQELKRMLQILVTSQMEKDGRDSLKPSWCARKETPDE